MQKTIIIAAAAVLSFIGTASAKFSFGWCAQPTLQSSFDVNQYLGTWFEAARDDGIIFEYGDCTQARYSLNADNTLNVHNSLYNAYTNQVDSAKAKAKCDGPQCHVKFFLTYSGDYRVVSTDYTNYSVVYSCTNHFWLAKTERVWILTRTANPDASVIAAAENAITTQLPNYGLSPLYRPAQGGSCQYLP